MVLIPLYGWLMEVSQQNQQHAVVVPVALWLLAILTVFTAKIVTIAEERVDKGAKKALTPARDPNDQG